MNNNLIIKKMRRIFCIRLIPSALLFVVSMGLGFWFPGENYFFPRPLNSRSHYENFYNRDLPYVTVTVPELSYTGCRYAVNGLTEGYYYYTLNDGFCQFYLLGKPYGKDPLPLRPGKTLKGRLVRLDPKEYRALLSFMAEDLNWTVSSLERMAAPYAVSTLPYPFYLDLLFRLAAGLGAAIGLSDFLGSLFYLLLPEYSPAFRFLRSPEKRRLHLAKAELEMRHTVLSQTYALYLTPGYVISLDPDRLLLLPVSSIAGIRPLPGLAGPVLARLLSGTRLPLRAPKKLRVRITTAEGPSCVIAFCSEEDVQLLLDLCHEL